MPLFSSMLPQSPALAELLDTRDLNELKGDLDKLLLQSGPEISKERLESAVPVSLLRKFTGQCDQIAFFLHRKESTYQEEFFAAHKKLILCAYQFLFMQVKTRLDKALQKPVRSGPLKEQIIREKEELVKLDKEMECIKAWDPFQGFSRQMFFHYKGCFYHICTFCQNLLYELDQPHISRMLLEQSLLLFDFYGLWKEEEN